MNNMLAILPWIHEYRMIETQQHGPRILRMRNSAL